MLTNHCPPLFHYPFPAFSYLFAFTSHQGYDHFLRVCVFSCSVLSNSLQPRGLCNPPGSIVHGTSQARMLEWVAISFSRGIFPNQGLNPCLLHCKEILNCCATGEAWVVLCVQAQSYLTPWDPMDYRPPGSSVHGILQARILEWIAMSSSRGSFRPRDRTQISCNSCFGRQIHSPLSHVESPWMVLYRDPVPIFCMWIFSFSWRKKWQTIPVFLPREFHGQRSLSGCSPWGCKELDTTEQPTPTHSVFPTPSNDVIFFPCWMFLTYDHL